MINIVELHYLIYFENYHWSNFLLIKLFIKFFLRDVFIKIFEKRKILQNLVHLKKSYLKNRIFQELFCIFLNISLKN